MKNSRKLPVLYSVAVVTILLLICISATGCGQSELPETQDETAINNGDNSYNLDGVIDSDDVNLDNERYFYDEDGRYAVHITSEDIIAYYDVLESSYPLSGHSRLENLVPFFDEFPMPASEESTVTYLPHDYMIDKDWSDYKHRLSQVKYNLKVHYSLESEIDRIIKRILTIDGVIINDDEAYGSYPVRWASPEIFDEFVHENIDIEIIGKEQSKAEDFGDLTWQVYSGGCYPILGSKNKDNVCEQHLFNLWLVDFTDTDNIIWDMKYVEEPGCGRLLPWQ